MKREYWILIAIVVVVILVILFRNQITGLFSSKKETQTPPTDNSTSGGTTATPSIDVNKFLAKGQTGAEVTYLQHLLNLAPYNSGLNEDGDFGPATEAALLKAKCVAGTTINDFPNKKCTEDSKKELPWYYNLPYGWVFG